MNLVTGLIARSSINTRVKGHSTELDNIIFRQSTKFRLFGIGCLMLSCALVIWQIPSSNDNDMISDTFDIFPAPIISVNDVDATSVPMDHSYQLTVVKGDTLMNLLTKQGIRRIEAHDAIQTLSEIYDPRKLKPGQEMELIIRPGLGDDGKAKIQSLKVKTDVSRDVLVIRKGDANFQAVEIERPLTTELVSTYGTIENSLYTAALAANMPQQILGSLINIFSFDVDFQREIRTGDTFAAVYERMLDENGNMVDSGNILVGEMTVQGRQSRFYRHKDKDGLIDYYDEKGRSVQKALLRTPVDGARITSSFGKRRHPILGYTKKHTGIDFGARKGTPIYAAGDGTVEFSGRNGNYGNYVRIKHDGQYKTAYAHMWKFAKGIRKGVRVRQRQIIGYVGSTGRSTGPHLHYEVHKNNVKLNPLSVKLPTRKTLKGNELAAFKKNKARLNRQFAVLPAINKLADASQKATD